MAKGTPSYTSYSALFVQGTPNVGGFMASLTDVQTTAAHPVGFLRQDGINEYMYVQFGTAGASKFEVCTIATGYTDANGQMPPMAASFNIAATGITAIGMGLCEVNSDGATNGPYYGWILVKGIATAVAHSNTSVAIGNWLCPSTNTHGTVEAGGVAVTTAIGKALKAGATGVGDVTGVLAYYDFRGLRP